MMNRHLGITVGPASTFNCNQSHEGTFFLAFNFSLPGEEWKPMFFFSPPHFKCPCGQTNMCRGQQVARQLRVERAVFRRSRKKLGNNSRMDQAVGVVGVRCGTVVWGSALQAEMRGVRFTMVPLEFFIDIILSAGTSQPLTEMSTRNFFFGVKEPVRRADKLVTFLCRLSRNLGASTPWNPLALKQTCTGTALL